MLNGGALDGANLIVTAPTEHEDQEETESNTEAPIEQTDKPRAGIAAEYLAKGYALSDQILQRAIELDKQRGISRRFMGYIQQLDSTLGQKAVGPEQTLSGAVSGKVSQTFSSTLSSGVTTKVSQTFSQTLTQARERAKSIDEQAGISSRAGDVRSFIHPSFDVPT